MDVSNKWPIQDKTDQQKYAINKDGAVVPLSKFEPPKGGLVARYKAWKARHETYETSQSKVLKKVSDLMPETLKTPDDVKAFTKSVTNINTATKSYLQEKMGTVWSLLFSGSLRSKQESVDKKACEKLAETLFPGHKIALKDLGAKNWVEAFEKMNAIVHILHGESIDPKILDEATGKKLVAALKSSMVDKEQSLRILCELGTLGYDRNELTTILKERYPDSATKVQKAWPNFDIDQQCGADKNLARAWYLLRAGMDYYKKNKMPEGIFRLSPNIKIRDEILETIRLKNTSELDSAFDQLQHSDQHIVPSIMKMYIGEMLRPGLIEASHYQKIADALPNESTAIDEVRGVISDMPSQRQAFLKELIQFLSDVAAGANSHQMNAKNLAVVWAPQILQTSTDSAADMAQATKAVPVLEYLIDHFKEIFELPSAGKHEA